jgi:hypothetical protein
MYVNSVAAATIYQVPFRVRREGGERIREKSSICATLFPEMAAGNSLLGIKNLIEYLLVAARIL